MKKIAFLFLILDNPNFPKIWNSYFRNNKNKYSIYIHPKFPEKTVWKKKNIIKNLHETSWGFITEAYLELLKEAYKDPDNYKFITISESCVPIQSFDKFYNDAINDNRSWIKNMHITEYDKIKRIKPFKEKLHYEKNIIKNYARFCLNRDHVKLLLEKEKELNFFHKMHVGDEFFLSVLQPLTNYKDFDVTFDDWDYTIKKGKEIKNKKRLLYEKEELNHINRSVERDLLQEEYNKIRGNPKTIIDVTDDLDKIKKCKSYFYRKFSKDSNIEKYWKDIINAHS